MTRIYICGSGGTCDQQPDISWRQDAARLLSEYMVINPGCRVLTPEQLSNHDDIVRADARDLEKCDIMLLNADEPNWCAGAQMSRAWWLGITIYSFGTSGKQDPWVLYYTQHSSSLVSAVDEIKRDISIAGSKNVIPG